ncbi:MAG: TIR domain-containing protein [Anaerolineae bacterium]|nr:TIR domain-containing protein [Anaerolineae bacterium]
MSKVFISYSSQDKNYADLIHGTLEAAGHRVWMDRTGLHGGDAWLQAIQQNILEADTMIVIWSANALQSRWVRDELTFAHSRGKQIIPVQIDGTDGSEHIIINALQMVNATDAEFEHVVEAIEQALVYGEIAVDHPTLRRTSRTGRWRWVGLVGVLAAVLVVLLGILPLLRSANNPPVTVTLSPSMIMPSSTPPTQTVVAPITLDAINAWRQENGYAPLTSDPILSTIADRHVSDLRSRPLSEPYNEYRDLEGRSVQEIAAAAGFEGEVEMFVKITDSPMPLSELIDEIGKRGDEDVQTRYDLVGFDWTRSVATGKHYYVLVMGRKN